MRHLGYPEGSENWVRPYHSRMSDWDKDIIAKAFRVNRMENIECVILVATNAYGMGIDNPDIRLVIQQDLPIRFDSMIQCMGREGKKGQQSTFVLFTPKQTQVKGSKEIERQITKCTKAANANAQLSDQNRPKNSNVSPLNQAILAKEFSENESVNGPDNDFNNQATNQLFDLLFTEAETEL